jgi:hypothetical protein
VFLVGCGAGEVTLVLERQDTSVTRPGAVRVLFQILGVANPLIFDAVDVEDPEAGGRRFADIPPGQQMYADVFGCTQADACSGADVVARGCSDRFTLEAGESREVPVVLEQPADGLVSCEQVAGLR